MHGHLTRGNRTVYMVQQFGGLFYKEIVKLLLEYNVLLPFRDTWQMLMWFYIVKHELYRKCISSLPGINFCRSMETGKHIGKWSSGMVESCILYCHFQVLIFFLKIMISVLVYYDLHGLAKFM